MLTCAKFCRTVSFERLHVLCPSEFNPSLRRRAHEVLRRNSAKHRLPRLEVTYPEVPTHFDGAQQSSERPSPASSRGDGEAFSDCLPVQRGYRYIRRYPIRTKTNPLGVVFLITKILDLSCVGRRKRELKSTKVFTKTEKPLGVGIFDYKENPSHWRAARVII